jgi:protein-tyrosine phosphatase
VCHGRGHLQRAELHFHLLPDVDDGPVDLDEAVELARLAVADGTSLVTVTPHVRDLLRAGILSEVPARVDEVAAALARAGVPLELRAGAELAHDDVALLDDRELDAIAQGPPGARWVLLEAPLFGGDVDGFLAATAEVRERGFGTLIGHPSAAAR